MDNRAEPRAWPAWLPDIRAFKPGILFYACLFCIFYPFKGLLAAGIYLFTGWDQSARLVVPLIVLSMFCLVLLSFLLYRGSFRKMDLILGGLGLVYLGISLLNKNFEFTRLIILIFFLPIVFTPIAQIPGKQFMRIIAVFFTAFLAYCSVEYVLFNTHLLGFTEGIYFSTEDIGNYVKLTGLKGHELEDPYRQGSFGDMRKDEILPGMLGGVRTAGFMGQLFSMAAMMSMMATFFYISFRLALSAFSIGTCLLSIFLLFNSYSTSAVVAFILTVIFYEVFYRKGVKRYIAGALVSAVTLILVLAPTPLSYLFKRLTQKAGSNYFAQFGIRHSDYPNFDINAYFHANGYSEFAKILIFGNRGWLPNFNRFHSENDLINVTIVFGVFVAFFLFKRWLWPAFQARKFNNNALTLYSLVVLNGVLGMIHQHAIFNPNVFMLIILLNVKAYSILNHETGERA